MHFVEKIIEKIKNNRRLDNVLWLLGTVTLLAGGATGIYTGFRFVYCEAYDAFSEGMSVLSTPDSVQKQKELYEFVNDHLGKTVYLNLVINLKPYGGDDSECKSVGCDPKVSDITIDETSSEASLLFTTFDSDDEPLGMYAIEFNKANVNFDGSGKLCCPDKRLYGYYTFYEGVGGQGVDVFELKPASSLDTDKQECTADRFS